MPVAQFEEKCFPWSFPFKRVSVHVRCPPHEIFAGAQAQLHDAEEAHAEGNAVKRRPFAHFAAAPAFLMVGRPAKRGDRKLRRIRIDVSHLAFCGCALLKTSYQDQVVQLLETRKSTKESLMNFVMN